MNTLTHTRTANGGTPELITTRAAIAEIETVMNAGHDDGTEMYGSGSTYNITYPDGRKVDIRPATPEQIAELTDSAMPKGAGGWTKPCNRRDRARFATLPADRKRTVLTRSAELYDGTHAVTHTFTIALDEDEKRHTTPEHTADGRRIVTVNGKRYIIGAVSQAKTTVIAGNTHVWPGGVKYWTERNGDTYGPIRTALANSKPGTVGVAIWSAANS